MKFCTDIHGAQRINYNDVGDLCFAWVGSTMTGCIAVEFGSDVHILSLMSSTNVGESSNTLIYDQIQLCES